MLSLRNRWPHTWTILRFAGASASHRLHDSCRYTEHEVASLLVYIFWRADLDSSYCEGSSDSSTTTAEDWPPEGSDSYSRARDEELGWLGAHGWETED